MVAANDEARHTLRSDETLSSVARKYGVSVQDIQQQNDITDPHKVYAGTVMRIPGQGGSQSVAAGQPASGGPDGRLGAKSGKAEKAAKTTYTVQANDTLWKISRTYNVSVDDLKRWNSVDEKNLRTGARLVVEQ